jgi:hypothetical protein
MYLSINQLYKLFHVDKFLNYQKVTWNSHAFYPFFFVFCTEHARFMSSFLFHVIFFIFIGQQ